MALLTRRRFLGALAGLPVSAAAGAGYMAAVEPGWFEVTRKTIDLDGTAPPVTALHLSDFHASADVSYRTIENAIGIALEQEADIAFLTGDFITWELQDEPSYRRILRQLSNAMPVFACIGNHDGGRWAGRSRGYPDFGRVAKLLESADIRLLFNRRTELSVAGRNLVVAGLGDLWSDDLRPAEALQRTPGDKPVIVLSHNPDSKETLFDWDWNLMLCGHTHGGQLVIPVTGARPFLPVRDTSFPEGLRRFGRHQVHITRGVGNLHGMRFNCRPEISVLELL